MPILNDKDEADRPSANDSRPVSLSPLLAGISGERESYTGSQDSRLTDLDPIDLESLTLEEKSNDNQPSRPKERRFYPNTIFRNRANMRNMIFSRPTPSEEPSKEPGEERGEDSNID
ncbi:hypothetical protein COL5a_006962 [Colletotrichum fioriniae]|nr:hypothetical protein COL5a_006962 [Colletotrichum fioriniae]